MDERDGCSVLLIVRLEWQAHVAAMADIGPGDRWTHADSTPSSPCELRRLNFGSTS